MINSIKCFGKIEKDAKTYLLTLNRCMGTRGGNTLGFPPFSFSISFSNLCRMLTIQNVLNSSRLGEYFTYSQRTRAMQRKFSTGSSKKVFVKSEQIHIIFSSSTVLQKLQHWSKLFFEKPVENFLCIAQVRCEYVNYSPNPDKYNAL